MDMRVHGSTSAVAVRFPWDLLSRDAKRWAGRDILYALQQWLFGGKRMGDIVEIFPCAHVRMA